MKKLLIVSDDEKKNFLSRIGDKLFKNRTIYCYSGAEAERIIDLEKPDFLYMDIKPVNGEDLMNTLRYIDGNVRLRVAIFYLSLSKKEKLSFKPLLHSTRLTKAAN